jgi:hypothetical protein
MYNFLDFRELEESHVRSCIMVATNSLSLSGVIIFILHVAHSGNKLRRKNSCARERHDGQISHSLRIFPAAPPCRGNGLHFLPIPSNSHHNTNTYKKHSRQDSKRIMFPGTSFNWKKILTGYWQDTVKGKCDNEQINSKCSFTSHSRVFNLWKI